MVEKAPPGLVDGTPSGKHNHPELERCTSITTALNLKVIFQEYMKLFGVRSVFLPALRARPRLHSQQFLVVAPCHWAHSGARGRRPRFLGLGYDRYDL